MQAGMRRAEAAGTMQPAWWWTGEVQPAETMLPCAQDLSYSLDGREPSATPAEDAVGPGSSGVRVEAASAAEDAAGPWYSGVRVEAASAAEDAVEPGYSGVQIAVGQRWIAAHDQARPRLLPRFQLTLPERAGPGLAPLPPSAAGRARARDRRAHDRQRRR